MRAYAMSDLLTPDRVQTMLGLCNKVWPGGKVQRLCRDYLTLWDRNKELETEIDDLSFDGLLRVAERLLRFYPEDSIVSSSHPNADIGARFTDSLRRWTDECRKAVR
ncbi:hypothetical protein LCGC14_3109230 [marine sediment metagenome]|uniref:Uncharacterized protein n=1 Tax=marine sediment metagenome TaxID=412755 RepID=A0A0F8W605_9ZZZZ